MSPVIELPDQEISTGGTAAKQPLHYVRVMSSGTIETAIVPSEMRLGPPGTVSIHFFDNPVVEGWTAGSPLHRFIHIDRLFIDVGTSEGSRVYMVEGSLIAEGVQGVLLPGEVAERLGELSRLEPDWDGSGGVASTPGAQLTARRILIDLLGSSRSPDPIANCLEILPIANGGLLIILTGAARETQLRIRPDGTIDVLTVQVLGGERTYEERHQISRDEAVRYLHEVPVDV
jgi:hypothetical protein